MGAAMALLLYSIPEFEDRLIGIGKTRVNFKLVREKAIHTFKFM